MYIKQLKIDAFGVLRGREIELSPTLNIIEGKNESGKSALAMFIKFMLYGLSGKSAGGELSERRRYVNWDTGTAAGSMTIVTDGREVRVERLLSVTSADDGARVREAVRESVRMIDTQTGTPIHRGEVPGEALLGVPEVIFMNTVFVRQIDGTRPTGGSVLSAIENLLFSADEHVSTERAISRLDDARREILHKNESGGALYEMRAERSRIAAELAEAQASGDALLNAETELSRAGEARAELDERILRQEKICACGEISLLKRRFDTAAGARKKLDAMRAELAQMDARGQDAAYIAQLDECTARIGSCNAALEKLAAAQEELSGRLGEADEKDEQIRAETERVLNCADILLARMRSMTAATLTLFFFAILMGLGGWMLSMFHISLYAVPIIAAAVLAALGIVCLFLRGRAAGDLAELLREWGAMNTGELGESVAQSMGGSAASGALRTEQNQLNAASAEAAARRGEAIDRLFDLAEQAVEITEPDTEEQERRLSAATEAAAAARAEAERHCAAVASLRREADTLEGRLSLLCEQLSGADEAEVRRTFAENMKTVEGRIASGMDAAKLDAARRELEALREERRQFEETHHQLDTRLAVDRARSASPAELAEKLSVLDAQIEELRRRHEAYCLAIETMQRASETVRAGLLPRIVQDACAAANRISDGRFEAIGIDHGLSMSFTRGGQTRDIEYLSEGTKDLAYISLRRALCRALFGENCPPLIYDESFARIDEHRLARILEMLNIPEGEENQSIILSCRRLEAELASENGGAAVIRL